MLVSGLCLLLLNHFKIMMYLIGEISLYLLAALLIGFLMGWILKGLQLDRYTRSLQQQLDEVKKQ